MNMSQYEEQQRVERDKSQKAIDDFENEIIVHQKDTTRWSESFREMISHYGLFDNADVVGEYNRQVDMFDDELRDARRHLETMREDHAQLLGRQRRDYDNYIQNNKHKS